MPGAPGGDPPRLAVVTGAGTGIGRAASLALAERGLLVVAVGRDPAKLQATTELARSAASAAPVEALATDLAGEAGRAAVSSRVDALQASGRAGALACVVQNAGVLGEVGDLARFTAEGFQKAFATNVEAPLFLTQALTRHLSAGGGRVLHIGSGAAHFWLAHWTQYCVTKAAFFQLMRCLDGELSPRGVRVGSVMPGLVDTPMQADLRQGGFPGVENFISMKEAADRLEPWSGPRAPPLDALDRPENVADFLAWLLLDLKAEAFGGREWDIRDPDHQRQWLDFRGVI